MKEMTKNIHLTGENADAGSSTLVDFYKDQTISRLATQSTEQNSLGLAQQMYEQMKREGNALTADEILARKAAEAQEKKETAPEEPEEPQTEEIPQIPD